MLPLGSLEDDLPPPGEARMRRDDRRPNVKTPAALLRLRRRNAERRQ